MKVIITAIAALFSFCSIASPGNGRRCATTSHMKEVREKHALQYPDAGEMRVAPQSSTNNPNVIYYIPVVVHVLWNTSGQNISDAQIQSQIDVLNEDYSRTNANAASTPGAFSGVASGTNFRFCLATVDPGGAITTGIERKQTNITEFQTDDKMKFNSTGGLNAWDVNRYLNIWVCNMADDILGYAETPDVIPHTNTFGVVIAYNAFGRTGTATSPYNLGRTGTHEVGHFFNLLHVWGDDNGACNNFGDGVADTPDQAEETYNCVNFPLLDNCSSTYPGVMFMNYMDYSDDACMNMFTAGQAMRMYDEISNYYPTLLNSNGCGNVGIDDANGGISFEIYPNPSVGLVNLEFPSAGINGVEANIVISNSLGEIVLNGKYNLSSREKLQLNLAGFTKGIYVISFRNEKFVANKRIIVQ